MPIEPIERRLSSSQFLTRFIVRLNWAKADSEG